MPNIKRMIAECFFVYLFLLVINLMIFILIRKLSPGSIVFTQGLYVISFVVFGFLLALVIFSKIKNINPVRIFNLFLVSLFAALSFYSFLITIPTLLDRSISIFLLAELKSSPNQSSSLDHLNRSFIVDYVDGSFQVEKRISEQISIGNLKMLENGNFQLTSRGLFIANVNYWLAKLFTVDTRYTNRS